MDKKEILRILNSEQFAGRIMKDVAALEMLLGIAVTMYFTIDDHRFQQLFGLIVEKMSFHQKLDVFKRLKFSKKYKSLQSIQSLTRLQKLRNLVAHAHYIGDFNTTDVLADKESMKLLSNYPHSYKKEVGLTRLRLHRIVSSKDFEREQ